MSEQNCDHKVDMILDSRAVFLRVHYDADCPHCLRRQIERLQSIVDKLPKTADGVSVTPGMTVIQRHPETGETWTLIVMLMAQEEFFFSCHHNSTRRYDECYSTREAAEAEEESDD